MRTFLEVTRQMNAGRYYMPQLVAPHNPDMAEAQASEVEATTPMLEREAVLADRAALDSFASAHE